MAKLTPEQISFLESHGLAVEDMFDGSNMSKRRREAEMKVAGKRFYFGGTPCGAAQHTLRTRPGHCIQCNTSHIKFATRYSSPARIYVAGSLTGQFIKIGSAENIDSRLVRLRSESYGGFDDWEMLAATPIVPHAGLLEAEAQRALSVHRQAATYFKAGVAQKALEIFSCDFSIAMKALLDVLPDPQLLARLCTLHEAKRYDWKRAA